MSVDRERVEMLYRESGRSPTVLRRRLARLDAIREPAWASEEVVAGNLIPMVLAGAWNQTNAADVEVIGMLSGGADTGELDARFRRLSRLEDAPVWEVGQHRGVVSKLDALFATGGFITADHLNDFLFSSQSTCCQKPTLGWNCRKTSSGWRLSWVKCGSIRQRCDPEFVKPW